jgi:hypothetical protein
MRENNLDEKLNGKLEEESDDAALVDWFLAIDACLA